MGKTPYELRYELLAMAQSILSEEMMGERMRLENDWSLEREKASIALSQNKETFLPPYPKMPALDPQKIIDLAETLNKFVSKND